MTTKYVSVCKNTVARNLKRGTDEPVIRVSEGKYGKPYRVHVYHPPGLVKVRVVYDPQNPMPWGARAWVEVDEEDSSDSKKWLDGYKAGYDTRKNIETIRTGVRHD
jgi:hypothetical protein